MQKRKWKNRALALFAAACTVLMTAGTVSADTDGTELPAVQPAQLEIRLGPDWAGAGFQLRTDAGLYPGELVVEETGVLRLEIGGSQSYLLSCTEPPSPPAHPAEKTPDSEIQLSIEPGGAEEPIPQPSPVFEEDAPRGLILAFPAVVFLAAGCLFLLHRRKRQRQIRFDRNTDFSPNRDEKQK